MISFIKSTWKAFVFPISCLFILILDQYFLDISLSITVFKLSIFSLLHFILVLKTKYVYDSTVYTYLSLLKLEYNKNYIIKPILTNNQITILFYIYLFVFTIVSLKITYFLEYKLYLQTLWFLLSIFFIFNCFFEIFRTLTNKADLQKVFVPHQLMQTRKMWQFFTKIAPTCSAFSKAVPAALLFIEVGIPQACNIPHTIGPLTKGVANNFVYPDCSLPIENRLELNYETFKKEYNTAIENKLYIAEKLPERSFKILHKDDFRKMKISESIIEAIGG